MTFVTAKRMSDILLRENDTGEKFEDETGDPMDTSEKDSTDNRKQVMMKTYVEDIGHRPSENTQRCINVVVRNTILPKMKFVPSGKAFGSFDKPDFTDQKSWVNILFSKIPNLGELSDAMKCRVWITYKARIKEQFSLHRAGITHKIKLNFVKCKLY